MDDNQEGGAGGGEGGPSDGGPKQKLKSKEEWDESIISTRSAREQTQAGGAHGGDCGPNDGRGKQLQYRTEEEDRRRKHQKFVSQAAHNRIGQQLQHDKQSFRNVEPHDRSHPAVKISEQPSNQTMPLLSAEDKAGLHWTKEEKKKLKDYILKNGEKDWNNIPDKCGLFGRSVGSCRSQWRRMKSTEITKHNPTKAEKRETIRLEIQHGKDCHKIAEQLRGGARRHIITGNDIKVKTCLENIRKEGKTGLNPSLDSSQILPEQGHSSTLHPPAVSEPPNIPAVHEQLLPSGPSMPAATGNENTENNDEQRNDPMDVFDQDTTIQDMVKGMNSLDDPPTLD